MRAHRLWAGSALLVMAVLTDRGWAALGIVLVALVLLLASFDAREA